MRPRADLVSPRDVSVVVPAHEAGDALRLCLEHLSAANPQPGEIIIVADEDGDAIKQLAEPFCAHVIQTSHRSGAPLARNLGARTSRGRVLLFIDSDVAVASNAIGEVVAALNGNPEWAAVFGSYDDAPGATNFISQYKGLLNHFVHQRAQVEASTFWTACGAIRKDAFLTIGGFDPAQRLEDIELGYRLRARGLHTGVRKTLLSKHLKRWTLLSLIRSDFFDRALPWTELMLQHKRADNDLNLDTASRVSVICAFALIASAVIAWWQPIICGAIAAVASLALIFLNRCLYSFFLRKRGMAFTLAAICWHSLYFFYGGVAFAVGTLRHLLRARHVEAPDLPEPEAIR